MTGGHLLFVVVGALTMLVGGTALVRPALARQLLHLPEHEATVYGLRIGGMMVATFGLVLLVFVIVFTTAGAPR
jgi:hypothetical protein